MKKTLVINYQSTHIGGIEKHLLDLVKYLINNNDRVIWMYDTSKDVDDSMASIMLDKRVEIVDTKVNKFNWFRHNPISFNNDEHIVIISFSPADYARAESIRRQNKEIDISHFYLMPHFTGEILFLERYFKGWLNNYVKKKLSLILERLDQKNAIKFFSSKHAEVLSTNYGINIFDKEEKLVKIVFHNDEFDYQNAYRLANSKEFRIITVSRFEFPHKGYILGLIDSYEKLKNEYPNLKLTIVGYGQDVDIVIEKIQSLDPKIQKDIELIGELSPYDLKQYFKNTNLNISVAGSVRAGAIVGTLSVPARHYSYECEVYGYLPESASKTLSVEKGIPVEKVIVEVMNMTADEYVRYSKAAYDCYTYGEAVDPLYLFNNKNNANSIMSNKDIIFMKLVLYSCKAKYFTTTFKERVRQNIGNIEI